MEIAAEEKLGRVYDLKLLRWVWSYVHPYRRLFFLSLLLGAATFNLFYSFIAGLLMFVGLHGFGLWATRRDPEMLRILLASSRVRRRYDPGKHQLFNMDLASW